MFLEKAVDLADRLISAFDTPSGIPLTYVNLARRKSVADKDNHGVTTLAEAGSLHLEFKYLSEITGDYTYWKKVEKAGY